MNSTNFVDDKPRNSSPWATSQKFLQGITVHMKCVK
jgi:hypothetical protein